jgi:hypothetical protein
MMSQYSTSASDHHFLKRKLTNKTAITKAAAMAVVPWAFIESPQRLTSSLSMAQLSSKFGAVLSGGFGYVPTYSPFGQPRLEKRSRLSFGDVGCGVGSQKIGRLPTHLPRPYKQPEIINRN